MSKRGTNSAKFIGGKDWKNGHVKSTLKAHLKEVRTKKKKEQLNTEFEAVAGQFGYSENAPYLKQYRKCFVNLTNSFNQKLFLKNVVAFKQFCDDKDIDYTIENYVDNKYYLKDYTGKVEDMSFSLKGLDKNQLVDKQLDFYKSDLPEEPKKLIVAHLDFLINNFEIKNPVDLKAKVDDYLALRSKKEEK